MIGGVSRQPPSIRLQNQCEEMINCLPSVTDFLKRRSGTSHIAKLLNDLPDNAFVDFIVRGENDTGILIITGGKAAVYNLSGKLIGEVSNSYLTTPNPSQDLRLLTINDYNFILNIKKTVGKTETPNSAYENQGGFIFVKQASYNTTYSVTINGLTYIYTTPKDDNNGTYKLTTSLIAEELSRKIANGETGRMRALYECSNHHKKIVNVADGAPHSCNVIITPIPSGGVDGEDTRPYPCGSSFTFVEYIDGEPDGSKSYPNKSKGTIIWIKPSGAQPLTIEVSDDMGGAYIKYFKNVAPYFTELPLTAPNGYIMEISGDPTTSYDNYYVKFVADNNKEIGVGYWKETTQQGVGYSLNALTLPVALIVENGVTFKPIAWSQRLAGDNLSCPEPSFVGKAINDIFFYRNRLCFLTGDDICMSEAGEFFNFFATTATALLDSDPIDVAAGSVKVSRLKYAIPFNEGLFIYSDRTLFVAEHGDVLSAGTISIRPLIQFDTDITARPTAVDASIFYVTSRANASAIREYRAESSGDLYGYSGDITNHIPNYIPIGVKKIAASMEENTILIIDGSNTVYVYNYQNGSNNERLQSAWGKWVFGGEVIYAEIVKGYLYLVIRRDDGVYLEKLDISARDGNFKDRRGLSAGAEDYISSYDYSTQYLRWEAQNPTVTGGHVMLRTLTLKYADTGGFKVIISRKGRREEQREINRVDIGDGEARFAILARNEGVELRVESVTDKPFKLTESRFEAIYTNRSRQL